VASVEELKAKTAEALKLYDRLRARQALATRAGLTSEYSGVVSRFGRIRDALQKLTDTGSMVDAVKVLWNGQVQGLGVAPLVIGWGVASVAIAGAVTLITKWLTDAYELDRRLDAAEKGVNVPAASGDTAKGWKIEGLALPAAAVAVVILGPRLWDAWNSRKG